MTTKTVDEHQLHVRRAPGGQKAHHRISGSAVIIYIAIASSITLALQAYFAANPVAATPPDQFPWSLELLSLNESISLLLALVGVAVIRNQYSRAHQPYLTYEGGITRDRKLLPPSDDTAPVHQVILRNVGPGMALVSEVRFRIAKATTDVAASYDLDYTHLVDQLSALDVRSDRDYVIAIMSRGAAIGSDTDVVIGEFEISKKELALIDMRLTVTGVLGDRYTKDVYLLGTERPG